MKKASHSHARTFGKSRLYRAVWPAQAEWSDEGLFSSVMVAPSRPAARPELGVRASGWALRHYPQRWFDKPIPRRAGAEGTGSFETLDGIADHRGRRRLYGPFITSASSVRALGLPKDGSCCGAASRKDGAFQGVRF